MSFEHQKEYEALIRLLEIARRDTGQSRRVADFLLAWYNAEENGGWDPVDLWRLDTAIVNDILTVLRLIAASHRYPDDHGFQKEIEAVWKLWRGTTVKEGAPDSGMRGTDR
jgi:hypothetical protein